MNSLLPPRPAAEPWPTDAVETREVRSARFRTAFFLRGLDPLDRAVYRHVAGASLPLLDVPLRRVSHFANFSKPWLVVAGCLTVFGGRRGRRAAIIGLGAVGTTSLVVNQPMKLAGDRARPDRRWPRSPRAATGGHAHVDIVPLRSLRVRRSLRRGRRRCHARAAAAPSGGRRDGGVLPRLHRRALPERCTRRGGGRADRQVGLARGEPMGGGSRCCPQLGRLSMPFPARGAAGRDSGRFCCDP